MDRASSMRRASDAIGSLTVLVLGLAAGALLAEGGVLVPFWRSASAGAFLEWYASHASLLFRFFAPLEIGGAGLALAAALLHGIGRRPGAALWAVAALLTLAVLIAFPLYFAGANASFASGDIDPRAVAGELARWARWHWGRSVLAVAAFGATILAVRRRA